MQQYNNLLSSILEYGEPQESRSGETLQLFKEDMKFDLREGFPLISCRKMSDFWKYEFCAFIIQGSCQIQALGKYAHIWKPWADKNGYLGPMYGEQMRFLKGESDKRIDQVQTIINKLKADSNTRYACVTTWNVAELENMGLGCCHGVWLAFNASSYGYLDAHFVQRSGDMGIGVPHNLAYYGLLLTLIAQECGLKPRFMHYTINYCHIYKNQIDSIRTQVARYPQRPCQIKLHGNLKNLTPDMIEVIGYNPHKAISFPPAAVGKNDELVRDNDIKN